MPINVDVKIPQVVPYTIKKTLLQPDTSSDPELVLGVELEIENLAHDEDDRMAMAVPGMNYHSDGSLRNYGGEFVTLPMKMRELEYVLNQFFMKNKLTKENYSERCSVHVHANVGDLAWEQLKVLTLVYLVFERLLFSFIGEGRDKNIFCVPLYDTNYTSNLLSGKDVLGNKSRFGKWEKYTALNFLPIKTQGSIEFRHMAGTNDLKYIMTWCNIIGKMFVFAKTKGWDEAMKFFMNLNTSSAYHEALYMVFGEYAGALQQTPNFTQLLEEGVLSLKYAVGVAQIKPKKVDNDEEAPSINTLMRGRQPRQVNHREWVFNMLNVPGQTRRMWQEGDMDLIGVSDYSTVVRLEVPLTTSGNIPSSSFVWNGSELGRNERGITTWRYINPEGEEVAFPHAVYPEGARVYKWIKHSPPSAEAFAAREAAQLAALPQPQGGIYFNVSNTIWNDYNLVGTTTTTGEPEF